MTESTAAQQLAEASSTAAVVASTIAAITKPEDSTTEKKEIPCVKSQFLHPPLNTEPSTTPAIIYIRRDQLLPVPLEATTSADAPPTLNTRFGSFPHSHLLSIPYGSQVRAVPQQPSARKLLQQQQKRKRPLEEGGDAGGDGGEDGEEGSGSRGFVHILAPTPELWTASLPHRTQVVYTPDSSYVLHRLRVRPGHTIIEAGAGSGSFTHAAVRAVYGGLGKGRVISYEFHELRANRLREEISAHGLSDIVTLVDGDVCEDGFTFLRPEKNEGDNTDEESPSAPHTSKTGTYPDPNAIFLDLPSPHLAIPHIRRSRTHAVRLCTFSPCMEQVTKTHAALHRAYWQDIETVELAHKKVEVHYAQINTTSEPTTPAAQLDKLKELAAGRKRRILESNGKVEDAAAIAKKTGGGKGKNKTGQNGVHERPRKLTLAEASANKVPLISRYEPEIKTHTSYLTFATLPMKWDEGEEAEAVKIVEKEREGYVQEVDKGWKKDYEFKQKQKEQKAAELAKKREEKLAAKAARRGGNEEAMEVDEEDIGNL